MVKDDCIAENEKGIKLYNLNGWTLSLDTDGKLKKQKCLLYTLPYNDEMVDITTKTGKRLVVTKNHPFLVNENGMITWKKAEDLTKQDYLVNPAIISLVGTPKIMPHEEAIGKMTQRQLSNEIPFDEDFAFWIAFLLSDGSIGEKHVEAVQKNYPEALDNFIAISKKYGFNPKVSENRGCRYARIYSKSLVEYLNIRFNVQGGKNKEIPSWFLSFPSEMNREFLKTFISLESSLRDNRIVFTQKSAKNLSIISYMLLREGILSWIKNDGRIFRLKIQGKDFIKFIRNIGWICENKIMNIDLNKDVKSSFRNVPVDKKIITRLVSLLGLDSFHTLKGRKKLIDRNWYGSYKGIKEGEIVMSVYSLQKFAIDIEEEVKIRKHPNFIEYMKTNPRLYAASMGLPITEIAEQLSISKNQVWHFYQKVVCLQETKIEEFLKEQFSLRVEEAERLLNYCKQLLSEDVYYDRIKKIEYSKSDGKAFGLTVPILQNYIAGFGGCGINHNTYPLPEAQADRFLLKINVAYPTYDQELQIVDRFAAEAKEQKLKVMLNKNHLLTLQNLVRQVPIANDIKQRAVKIVLATRQNKEMIQYGASPRASIGLILASKARALIQGRNHVSNDDLNILANPILRHRIILNFEAERKGMTKDDAIKQILDKAK
ncbi:MAG: LAGLIDADG family homing endonuclease [Nanoarchaeota archaeon]